MRHDAHTITNLLRHPMETMPCLMARAGTLSELWTGHPHSMNERKRDPNNTAWPLPGAATTPGKHPTQPQQM